MVIICISFVIEIIFAVYCIFTKSNQSKVKSLFRIGIFVAFLILIFLSAIKWGFRWYGLALLLFIWAIISIKTLLFPDNNKKEFKCGRIVQKGIIAFLLTVIVMVPAIIFSQYKPLITTGEYEVVNATYTLTDEDRLERFANNGEKRKVTVEFWYPRTDVGTYPLVVFSHGLYGIAESNFSTFRELASNGYIVCSVSHPYISMYTKDIDGKITLVNNGYMKTASILNSGITDEKIIYDAFKDLLKIRVNDINFVLDTIINKPINDIIYHNIDTSKICLLGHSMGGATMSVVSRERNDIDILINLDAPLFGEILNFQNNWTILRDDIYPKPLLNVYSDDLWGRMDGDPIYAANTVLLSDTPVNIYNVYINGAKHMNFTDLPIISPIIANMLQGGRAKIDTVYCLEIMNKIILEFINYNFRGICNINYLRVE